MWSCPGPGRALVLLHWIARSAARRSTDSATALRTHTTHTHAHHALGGDRTRIARSAARRSTHSATAPGGRTHLHPVAVDLVARVVLPRPVAAPPEDEHEVAETRRRVEISPASGGALQNSRLSHC